jgi:hypothetical protein
MPMHHLPRPTMPVRHLPRPPTPRPLVSEPASRTTPPDMAGRLEVKGAGFPMAVAAGMSILSAAGVTTFVWLCTRIARCRR